MKYSTEGSINNMSRWRNVRTTKLTYFDEGQQEGNMFDVKYL